MFIIIGQYYYWIIIYYYNKIISDYYYYYWIICRMKQIRKDSIRIKITQSYLLHCRFPGTLRPCSFLSLTGSLGSGPTHEAAHGRTTPFSHLQTQPCDFSPPQVFSSGVNTCTPLEHWPLETQPTPRKAFMEKWGKKIAFTHLHPASLFSSFSASRKKTLLTHPLQKFSSDFILPLIFNSWATTLITNSCSGDRALGWRHHFWLRNLSVTIERGWKSVRTASVHICLTLALFSGDVFLTYRETTRRYMGFWSNLIQPFLR